MLSQQNKSKRIAKNTFILYIRMLFLMVISLITSRVVLRALGVDNYGIYNVVAGFVAMFGMISGSLSSACSRFLNFEMGKGNKDRLRSVFATEVLIQLILLLLVLLVGESIGLWFLNNKMVIPEDRMYAANCVFQLSLLTFAINLISIPYNAAIISHEKMKAFAYVSIYEGLIKLIIAYLVLKSPLDSLIFYSIMMCILQLSVGYLYCSYCVKHFEECKFNVIIDKNLIKEIFVYSGWNFIGASSLTLRNQGNNILLNLFFGPSVNAARGISNQVLNMVTGFVKNFMTAMNPQITQSYASGEFQYMNRLIFQGARLSYYLLLILILPILVNTEYLLNLWLTDIPEYTIILTQLSLIFALIESVSGPLITVQLATGRIRNYQLLVGGIQLLNLPISYVCLSYGGSPESVMFTAIVLSILCLFARLVMLKIMINFDVLGFLRNVVLNVITVSVLSFAICFCFNFYLTGSFGKIISSILICFLGTLINIYFVGCSRKERIFLYLQTKQLFSKIIYKV